MNSLKSLQVLCSGVAHFAECSQSKVDRISIFSGTLTINFSPLKIDRRTSCAPHGPVKFWQPRERKRGLLVGLILGCFIKILHQIWNNKRLCGKLIESGGGGGAYTSVQIDSQRCQSAIQEKCVYPKHDNRCNAIPILCSSFPPLL